MARARRTDDPFAVIGKLALRPVPVNPVRRFLAAPVTDYEIIMAQQFEIMRLRQLIADG